MPHHLLALRREIPPGLRGRYLAGWASLQEAAMAAGAHAWLFAADREPRSVLEFIEWSDAAGDPRATPSVADALAMLAREFPGEEELWNEVGAPAEGGSS